MSEEQPVLSEEAVSDIVTDVAIEESAVEDEVTEAVGAEVVVEEAAEEVVLAEEERVLDGEIERRAVAVDMEMRAYDEKKRTVEIAVSSELPVERSFGKEILVHEPGAVDLGFFASGRAPLLLDHDMEKQIGEIGRASCRERV